MHSLIEWYTSVLGLWFSLDANKIATTNDKGATLTCRASIEFPPFSKFSLIKDRQTVSLSTSPGSLLIDTRSINLNQFGLYTCELNASGVIFQKTYILKEQGTMIIDVFNYDNIIFQLQPISR